MIRIIMHGCNGKMGQVITSIVEKRTDCTIVAGIDYNTKQLNDYPVFESLDLCDIDGDVLIDFSIASSLSGLLSAIKIKKLPSVLCTTGFSEEDVAAIHETSKDVAILYSRNMSLGVNLLIDLVQKATNILADAGFDIEIIEKHHNQKIDAPSGTALAFADAINEVASEPYTYVFDRSKSLEKRTEKEIGIHAIRGGTIVGEHSIIFAGRDEVIELKHNANSKEVFAVGAVDAARFLAGKSAGFYTMKDVIAN
ncbi:MAG: 4-hydroxy-tetrahydrodipicolinate reductase [Vallitaleaceae bacterium]|nr:4-hydroxy-tetrahydrodipicolinate reductase [Vallitaleaceae bacterium]